MIKNIIFDLGGVLIDWSPRALYQKIFDDSQEIDKFLSEICTQEWNEQQDAGRPFAKATALLINKYPDYKEAILAYDTRWDEMILGDIPSSVQCLLSLIEEDKYDIYSLTNWSAEKFPVAEKRFDFLKLFKGILVSGRINLKKPDPKIFNHLCDLYGIKAEESLFIDDSLVNIESAQKLGFKTIHFNKDLNLDQEIKSLL